MGRRGPCPKPTTLRIMQGNPGKTRLNPLEPKPPQAALDLQPPAFLAPAAQKVWSRLVPDLRAAGLLTSIDVDVLAAYCSTYARWREAEDFLKENGLSFVIYGDPTKKNPKGPVKYVQQYPQVSIAQKSLQLMCKFGAELGLSPAARSRIHVEKPEEGKNAASADAKRIFG